MEQQTTTTTAERPPDSQETTIPTRPFECDSCDATFTNRQYRNAHKAFCNANGRRVICCDTCRDRLYSEKQWRKHANETNHRRMQMVDVAELDAHEARALAREAAAHELPRGVVAAADVAAVAGAPFQMAEVVLAERVAVAPVTIEPRQLDVLDVELAREFLPEVRRDAAAAGVTLDAYLFGVAASRD